MFLCLTALMRGSVMMPSATTNETPGAYLSSKPSVFFARLLPNDFINASVRDVKTSASRSDSSTSRTPVSCAGIQNAAVQLSAINSRVVTLTDTFDPSCVFTRARLGGLSGESSNPAAACLERRAS